MKTANHTNGATSYFTKTIDVLTEAGLTAQLTLTRRVLAVTREDHKTETTYSITYKGKKVSSYDLNYKSEVKYFLNFLDNYAERIAASSY
tara:strand:+ start:288 stop:557 length:270 start_codon:yes stop_codon:yes gene_type:complete